MSTAPQSPFEGVAIVRLRPLYFALAALILAVPVCFGWWEIDGAIKLARLNEEGVRRGYEIAVAHPMPGLGSIVLRYLQPLSMTFFTLLLLTWARWMKREVPVR